jgi:hypothetical protein
MFLLLVLLWGGELARWSWVKYASFASVNGGRREFLAQVLAGGVGTFGLALSSWGVWSAIRPVEVKRVAVRLKKGQRARARYRRDYRRPNRWFGRRPGSCRCPARGDSCKARHVLRHWQSRVLLGGGFMVGIPSGDRNPSPAERARGADEKRGSNPRRRG